MENENYENKSCTKIKYLEQKVKDGLAKRYGNITDAIRTRAEYELKIISDANFTSRVLFAFECAKWLKLQDISFGYAIGIAPSSVVLYALGITNVDPIAHNLIFERFINPLSESTLPDIWFQIGYYQFIKIKDGFIDHLRENHTDVSVTACDFDSLFPTTQIEVKHNDESLKIYFAHTEKHPTSEGSMIFSLARRPYVEHKIPAYFKNKYAAQKFECKYEFLRDILDETYGVLIFDEQYLQIINRVTGFSFAQADLMRRALGTKKPERIQKWETDFLNAGTANGFDEKTTKEIFEFLCAEMVYCVSKANVLACVDEVEK